MSRRNAPRACVLTAGLAFASAWLLQGCGSNNQDMGSAAKLSPEMQKHQDEMLKNYMKDNAERARAARTKAKK